MAYANKELEKIWKRNNYSANREKIIEASKQYNQDNKAEIEIRYQLWRKSPRGRYSEQKKAAKRRGIPWEFDFDSWWAVWEDSGHWEARGIQADDFVMCRLGDTGPYSPDNVRIDTQANNMKERWATL